MAVAGDTIQVKKGTTFINGPAPLPLGAFYKTRTRLRPTSFRGFVRGLVTLRTGLRTQRGSVKCDTSFTCEDYNTYRAHPWSPFSEAPVQSWTRAGT